MKQPTKHQHDSQFPESQGTWTNLPELSWTFYSLVLMVLFISGFFYSLPPQSISLSYTSSRLLLRWMPFGAFLRELFIYFLIFGIPALLIIFFSVKLRFVTERSAATWIGFPTIFFSVMFANAGFRYRLDYYQPLENRFGSFRCDLIWDQSNLQDTRIPRVSDNSYLRLARLYRDLFLFQYWKQVLTVPLHQFLKKDQIPPFGGSNIRLKATQDGKVHILHHGSIVGTFDASSEVNLSK